MTVKVEVLRGTSAGIINYISDTLMMEAELTLYGAKNWELLMNSRYFQEAEIVTCFDGNEIVGIVPIFEIDTEIYYFLNADVKQAPFFEFFGFEDVYLPYVLEYLKEHFPDVLLDWDTNRFMEPAGYVISEVFDGKERLCLNGLQPYVLPEKEFEIMNAFKEYHARGEIQFFSSKVCSQIELQDESFGYNGVERLARYQQAPLLNSFTSFYGFKYFRPDILNPYSSQNPLEFHFVVVYSHELKDGIEKKRIVGVIALSDEGDSYCLAFINVHREYKRMGIAKLLYQTLNDFLKPTDILVSSGLSDEGQLAGLDKVRSSIITKCKVYENRDDFVKESYRKKVSN